MQILKYTTCEGGEWIEVTGILTEDDILSVPCRLTSKGYLWGFIHSYIREDGKKFDAFNQWGKYQNGKNSTLN